MSRDREEVGGEPWGEGEHHAEPGGGHYERRRWHAGKNTVV